MSSIIIVADDLTGANANGSLLTAKGFSAATCLDAAQWNKEYFSTFDAVALNSESRLLPKEEAARRVYDSMRMLIKDMKPCVTAKRIDSTLRGNLGAEIEAALRAVDDEAADNGKPEEKAAAVIVPAFPASGRHAVGGYLLVDGQPLERSEAANDAVTPVNSSSFLSIIYEQTKLPTSHIPLSTVLKGERAVHEAMLDLREQGIRIIACDSVSDKDIATIAAASANLPFPVLAVDPGPFTAAFAEAKLPGRGRVHEDRILLVVGSALEIVQRQLEALRLAHRCVIIRADCRRLIDPLERETAIEETAAILLARAEEQGKQAEIFGICTVEKQQDVLPLEDLATEYGLELKEVSGRINSGLAAIAEKVLADRRLPVGGLFTSGGEVTVAVARGLKASGFSVRDEVLPRAVYGRLIGGSHPGLPMVTKGGLVGNEKAIVTCIDYLFTKISTQTRPS